MWMCQWVVRVEFCLSRGSRVNAKEQEEMGAALKPLPAFITLVGPLPSGGPLVDNQVTPPPEAPLRLPTLTGPFPRVGSPVLDQVGSPPEALPTFQALVWILPIMKLLMDKGRGRRCPQRIPRRTALAAELSCSRGPCWAGRWSRREGKWAVTCHLPCLGLLGHLPLCEKHCPARIKKVQ